MCVLFKRQKRIEGEKVIDLVLTNKTIGECLKDQARRRPDSIALEFEEELFTWNDLEILSDRVAIALLKKGIRKGSHVGIWSVNSPNWIFTFFGLSKLGAVPVLLNTCYKEVEMADVLASADIEFLCYGDGYKDINYDDILQKISPEILPSREKCISIGRCHDGSWNGLREYSNSTRDEKDNLHLAMGALCSDDIAAILFTSGTSKTPKGVMLSHYSLVNNALEISTSMRWTCRDKMCIAVPMYHCFGITASLLVAVHTGCTMHLLKYYRTAQVFEKIQKHRCTILNGVPSMFLAIIHNEKRKAYDLTSIQSGIMAGSQISPCEYLRVCETLGIEHLQTSFGQTEASPCITISEYDDSLVIKSQTAGRKLGNVKLRIFDKETAKVLPAGAIGEIQTSGYHVMKGYYGMPEETKAVLDDGWLSTGDLGWLDEKGYLHVTGRMREMIIRGGENISPAEIEGCMCGFPNIKNIKVIGIKADVLQEEIAACIVSADGKAIDEKALRAFVKSRLSDYKVPKYILQFISLPFNASGKVVLKEMKLAALGRIRELYGENVMKQERPITSGCISETFQKHEGS